MEDQKLPKIINPQFIWLVEGQGWKMDIGSMGTIHIEFEQGKGWEVGLNNCFSIQESPCTLDGGFIGAVKHRYYKEEFEAKTMGLRWARKLILENLKTIETLIESMC